MTGFKEGDKVEGSDKGMEVVEEISGETRVRGDMNMN